MTFAGLSASGETVTTAACDEHLEWKGTCMLLTTYLCFIPQPHMLSKRMTAFRVLIVPYVDAIDEFMQPGNCYKCPHYGGQL